MGLFDDSALPEHLDDPHEWDGKDDDQHWWTRWRKRFKEWNAFGPRSPRGVAFSPYPPFIMARKWREVPKVLWAERGKGVWRYEADGKPDLHSPLHPFDFLPGNPGYYLSRNQYWCEWHKAVLWPLFFSWHRYDNPADVLPEGQRGDRDGKIKMFYAGAKRDADRIFWWVALFPGRNFK